MEIWIDKHAFTEHVLQLRNPPLKSFLENDTAWSPESNIILDYLTWGERGDVRSKIVIEMSTEVHESDLCSPWIESNRMWFGGKKNFQRSLSISSNLFQFFYS